MQCFDIKSNDTYYRTRCYHTFLSRNNCAMAKVIFRIKVKRSTVKASPFYAGSKNFQTSMVDLVISATQVDIQLLIH